MAQQINSFGFLKGSGSGGGGTDTNLGNTDLTADATRTYDIDGNTLDFNNGGNSIINIQEDAVTFGNGNEVTEVSFKFGANAPDLRLYEASGSGTNYVKLTCGALGGNRTITIPDDTGTMALLESSQQFTGKNSILIREFQITSSVDGNFDGDLVFFGSGSVTAGKCYYLSSAGVWTLADRRTEAASIGFLGVACATGTASSVGMCIRGMITMSTDTGDVGDVLWLRINGDFENAIPTSSGEYVRVVGYCLDNSNGQIFFNPSQDWTEIA